MKLRTSEEWASIHKALTGEIVLDPDGWDRKNYQYSWYEEEISSKEFLSRLTRSTIAML